MGTRLARVRFSRLSAPRARSATPAPHVPQRLVIKQLKRSAFQYSRRRPISGTGPTHFKICGFNRSTGPTLRAEMSTGFKFCQPLPHPICVGERPVESRLTKPAYRSFAADVHTEALAESAATALASHSHVHNGSARLQAGYI